ncbi:MAG: hypothetical protein U0414_12100 [Polyangiaceae bacterium]
MATGADIDEIDDVIAGVERAARPRSRALRATSAALVLLACVAAVNALRSSGASVESLGAALGLAALSWRAALAARRTSFEVLLGFARNELARGRFGSVERILDHLEPDARAARLERALDGLRGENALARGDVEAAVDRLRAAVAGVESGPLSPRTAALLPALRGHLALAHALSGEDDAALAAATRIRRMVEHRAYGPRVVASVATVRAMLARAGLAEIIVASRRDPSSVEPLVAASRAVILEGASPRERALLRAIERMARARVPSVYRRTARAAGAAHVGTGEWIERVLPDAAPFAHARAAPPVDARDGAALGATEGARPSTGPGARLAALAVLASACSSRCCGSAVTRAIPAIRARAGLAHARRARLRVLAPPCAGVRARSAPRTRASRAPRRRRQVSRGRFCRCARPVRGGPDPARDERGRARAPRAGVRRSRRRARARGRRAHGGPRACHLGREGGACRSVRRTSARARLPPATERRPGGVRRDADPLRWARVGDRAPRALRGARRGGRVARSPRRVLPRRSPAARSPGELVVDLLARRTRRAAWASSSSSASAPSSMSRARTFVEAAS